MARIKASRPTDGSKCRTGWVKIWAEVTANGANATTAPDGLMAEDACRAGNKVDGRSPSTDTPSGPLNSLANRCTGRGDSAGNKRVVATCGARPPEADDTECGVGGPPCTGVRSGVVLLSRCQAISPSSSMLGESKWCGCTGRGGKVTVGIVS